MQKQLNLVDDTLASYLKILPSEAKKFTYYTLELGQTEHWDIVGIQYLSKFPLLIDVRLMYIEQEACDWEPFVAERDAPGLITFNPSEYLTIIAFFETLLSGEIHDQGKKTNSFSLLDREELLQLRYSTGPVDDVVGIYYRYTPDIEGQDPSMINILCFPRWSPHYGIHQSSSLWFTSLSQHHLKDTQLDLTNDIDGLGTLRFNQSTLEEFVLLLKKHRKSDS